MANSSESVPIHIEITGTDGVRYDAHWVVTHAGEREEHHERDATVPTSLTYQGDALTGSVTLVSGTGRLEVEVNKSGNRSRSATQGEGATLQISVR